MTFAKCSIAGLRPGCLNFGVLDRRAKPPQQPQRRMALLPTPVPHRYPSIAFRDQIALAHPIGAEVVGDVERLYVGETQRVQELICRVDVGAMAPRAASAIKHDSRVLP